MKRYSMNDIVTVLEAMQAAGIDIDKIPLGTTIDELVAQISEVTKECDKIAKQNSTKRRKK
jgi:uncharacterized protein YqgV (UPF0045/DUF77 family)